MVSASWCVCVNDLYCVVGCVRLPASTICFSCVCRVSLFSSPGVLSAALDGQIGCRSDLSSVLDCYQGQLAAPRICSPPGAGAARSRPWPAKKPMTPQLAMEPGCQNSLASDLRMVGVGRCSKREAPGQGPRGPLRLGLTSCGLRSCRYHCTASAVSVVSLSVPIPVPVPLLFPVLCWQPFDHGGFVGSYLYLNHSVSGLAPTWGGLG